MNDHASTNIDDLAMDDAVPTIGATDPDYHLTDTDRAEGLRTAGTSTKPDQSEEDN